MFKLSKYKYYFAFIDFLIIIISCIISTYSFSQKYEYAHEFINLFVSVLVFLISLIILFIFIFDFNGLYKINIILSRAAHLSGLIKSYFYGVLVMTAIVFFSKPSGILDSRLFFMTFVISSILLFYIFRIEIIRVLFKTSSSKRVMSNVLIVGDGEAGKLLAARIILENPFGINIVGFIDDSKPIGKEIVKNKKILGGINQIQDIISESEVDEILISLDDISYEKLLDTLDICRQFEVNIRLNSKLFDIVSKKVSTEQYAGIPVLDIAPGYNNQVSVLSKRIFDIAGSFVGIVILLPFLLIIAILIKISSPGPVLYTQTRIGKKGKPFKFYKFRSMYNLKGEDEKRKEMMINFMKGNGSNSMNTKIINYSRVTWIGRILRKTSIDELPQLFNVLKGDMSLVGPRPCLPYEYENYDGWQKRRLNVLPGCTGLWQISGRSSVSFIDSIVLDLFYINSMSPWFDLQILFKTIPVMLFGRGGK